MSTAGLPACPICGDNRRMKKPKSLYNHAVCKKCWAKFANRRQLAWIIDVVGYRILVIFVAMAVGVAAALAEVPDDIIPALGFIVGIASLPFFMMKDGFNGYSPGKAITGVQAVDFATGQPIGLGGSLKRNLALIIPFVPLVIAVQMMKGPRLGDGWANTRVIWKKYAHSPVFRTAASPFEPVSAMQLQAALHPLPVDDTNPFRAPEG